MWLKQSLSSVAAKEEDVKGILYKVAWQKTFQYHFAEAVLLWS